MTRVLYVSEHASLRRGGQHSALSVIRALHGRDVAYSIVLPSGGDLERECRAIGVPVFVTPFASPRRDGARAIATTRRFIASVVAHQRIDVVHTESPRSTLYAMTLPRPLVFHARIAQRAWLFDRLVERLASRIVCVSRAVARRFRLARPPRLRVVLNGVDPRLFLPSAAKRASVRATWGLGDEPVVGMAAEMIPGKGVFDFVAMAAGLARTSPGCRFVVAGSGDRAMTDRVRTAVSSGGLDDRLLTLGHVSRMDELFAALDVFVLASRFEEGLPRTLIEAAASGVPAVAYDRGGCGEVIAPGETGLLVPVGDVGGLERAVGTLLLDEPLRRRMAARARGRAVELFDVARCARDVHDIYEEVTRP